MSEIINNYNNYKVLKLYNNNYYSTDTDNKLEAEESEGDALLEEDQQHDLDIAVSHKRHHLKLLLSKTSLFVLGATFVVIAGICSSFKIPDSLYNGNYTECSSDDIFNDDISSIILVPSPTPFYY